MTLFRVTNPFTSHHGLIARKLFKCRNGFDYYWMILVFTIKTMYKVLHCYKSDTFFKDLK